MEIPSAGNTGILIFNTISLEQFKNNKWFFITAECIGPENDLKNYILLCGKRKEEYIVKRRSRNFLIVATSHPHYKEWKIRKNSCNKLFRYIKRNGHICNILEVGCGNGWLAARLASVTKARVTGIDINTVELEQAKKVFCTKPNLKFIEGDIRSGILADEKFDLIVFAASIQYFKSLKEILNIAISI